MVIGSMRKDHRVRKLSELRIDGNYTKSYKEGGKNYKTKEYSYFHKMSVRCNNEKTQQHRPNYLEVVLDNRFKSYNYFVEWARHQVGFNEEGWSLDKDIGCHLLDKGKKIYSPETCMFIPATLNSFLTFRKGAKNVTGYAGVSWQSTYTKSGGKFIVSCAELNGKNKTLGRTDTAEEGYQLYRAHKIKLAKILADTYRGQVDERAIYYLDNFDKYIDDLAIFNK